MLKRETNMVRRTFWSVKSGVVLVILALAAAYHSDVALAQQATKMRWDIVKRITFRPNGINPGGVAFATAYDGSFIKLTGSGTLGPGRTDPVTGGGTWDIRPVGTGSSTGKGKYTVTELVSWQESKPKRRGGGRLIDNIGNKEDRTGGLIVLRIAYTNEDGSPAGAGVLIVSCRSRRGAAGVDLFEGVIASKGAVMYFTPAPSRPRVDANRTAFHRQAR